LQLLKVLCCLAQSSDFVADKLHSIFSASVQLSAFGDERDNLLSYKFAQLLVVLSAHVLLLKVFHYFLDGQQQRHCQLIRASQLALQ
jgi:hypothetical protein